MSKYRIEEGKIVDPAGIQMSLEAVVNDLNTMFKTCREYEQPASPAARTKKQIQLATGTQLNEAMGNLLRGSKTDADFRKDVLHRFDQENIIDPETGRVNHPLAINRRVQVGYGYGRIRGVDTINAVCQYEVIFDSCEFPYLIDQHWVWPVDENNQPMQAKKP